MEGKRADQATKTTEWKVNNLGFVSLAFGGFLLLGCLSAYLLAVARGNVEPFLPLISEAAGSPPQNGLFGGFMCVGGMFGVIFMILRYLMVLDATGESSCLLSLLNKLSLGGGLLAMLALTLVTGYPFNFYRNRDSWFLSVGLPHLIGGGTLFSCALLYIGLQCVLTLWLQTPKKTLLLRLGLLGVCAAAFGFHMASVPHHLKEMADNTQKNNTPATLGANLEVPVSTSVTSPATQWIFLLAFCCFLWTFFREMQDYALHFVVESRCNAPEPFPDRKAEIRRLSLAIEKSTLVKTVPEVRKCLRRDSTCQTAMMDPPPKKILASKDSQNGKNGKSPLSESQ